MGPVALRVRDLLRQIAMEHELEILEGKVARDDGHLVIAYRPDQSLSMVVEWLNGMSCRMLLEEFAHLRRQFWGRHMWTQSYVAVTSGTITDAMIKQYIADQEGKLVQDDSRFRIDERPRRPPSGR